MTSSRKRFCLFKFVQFCRLCSSLCQPCRQCLQQLKLAYNETLVSPSFLLTVTIEPLWD